MAFLVTVFLNQAMSRPRRELVGAGCHPRWRHGLGSVVRLLVLLFLLQAGPAGQGFPPVGACPALGPAKEKSESDSSVHHLPRCEVRSVTGEDPPPWVVPIDGF